MAFVEQSILTTIAKELNIRESQVATAIELLDQGASVPFIAHYRAARTDGLQDTQLRMLAVRLSELRALAMRRTAILQPITAQESPVPGLIEAINLADTRGRLEALNAPVQKKRRSTRTAQAQDQKDRGRPVAYQSGAEPRHTRLDRIPAETAVLRRLCRGKPQPRCLRRRETPPQKSTADDRQPRAERDRG